MAQVLSEKEVQQMQDSFEKVKERDAKIEALNLPTEDKNKLDVIIRGIDEFERGHAEQMAQAFLGIKEAFKFSKERVNVIKNEIIGGFAEGQLEKLNFPAEQKNEILKIIMGEEEKETAKEETVKTKESPEQELFHEAYDQLIKQKEYFLKELEEQKSKLLEIVNPLSANLLFFGVKVKEIIDILKCGDKYFYSTETLNSIENVLRYTDELKQNLETADKKKFISNFERYRDLITSFLVSVSEFLPTIQDVNWLSEFSLLFSYLEESNPEFTEKVSEKLEPLLKHFGFEQIYPKKGEEYNPREHKAEGEIAEGGIKRGQVVRVVRRGIKKGGEIVQKAGVIIGK